MYFINDYYLFYYITVLSCGRLDDIVKTKEDSEYSRLSHYNKGLKLLKETLKSEKTRHKGKNLPGNLPVAPLLCAYRTFTCKKKSM